MLQRALLFKRLEVAEVMRAFISHYLGGSEELHPKLEWVEADLVASQKAVVDGVEALKLVDGKKEEICAEANQLKEKRETMEAKFKGAE